MNFHDNSKNKNWEIDFSFDSAHSKSFIKTVAKLRDCITLVGKKPKIYNRNTFTLSSQRIFNQMPYTGTHKLYNRRTLYHDAIRYGRLFYFAYNHQPPRDANLLAVARQPLLCHVVRAGAFTERSMRLAVVGMNSYIK